MTFKHELVTEILHEPMLHYLRQVLQQYCSDSAGRNTQVLKKYCSNSFGCNTNSDAKEFAVVPAPGVIVKSCCFENHVHRCGRCRRASLSTKTIIYPHHFFLPYCQRACNTVWHFASSDASQIVANGPRSDGPCREGHVRALCRRCTSLSSQHQPNHQWTPTLHCSNQDHLSETMQIAVSLKLQSNQLPGAT